MNYETPYITAEEYLKAKGVDLSIEIQDNDDKTDKVNRFIRDLTDFVMTELSTKYGNNDLNTNVTEFSSLPEWRRKRFHLGMIEQVEYMLNNGLLHQDSGIMSELGTIMDYSRVFISNSAHNQFYLGAFCNIVRY